MENTTRQRAEGIWEKRWLLIPVIFVVWSAAVVFVVQWFTTLIPEVSLIKFGMTLEDLKTLVAHINRETEEHYTNIAAFLAFLFL